MYRLVAILLLIAVPAVGCESTPDHNRHGGATDTETETADTRTFTVHGTVVEVRADGRELVIDHEEMPGYMSAMTMPFPVADGVSTAEIIAGDSIEFRFEVRESIGRITGVSLISRPSGSAVEADDVSYAAPSGESLYLVDYSWSNQDGETVRLADLAGKPVVLSMVFTQCGYSCPLIVTRMKQLANQISDKGEGAIQYVLVSLDPERDTPDVLRHFARSYGLNETDWTLLRGEADQVRMLAALLGIRYRQQSDGQFAHTSLITVLDQDGVIVHQQKGLGADEQSSRVLASLIGDA